MRLLLGIILGVGLTIGGAYLYDSQQAAANGQADLQRPMVNWDVVVHEWDRLTALGREEWKKLRAQAS